VVVLRAVGLIDGTGREGVGGPAEVHIEGTRLTYAGPSREAPPCEGVNVIAVAGDQLVDPSALSRVDFVMRGGTIYKNSDSWT
jgi:hypothetical protein